MRTSFHECNRRARSAAYFPLLACAILCLALGGCHKSGSTADGSAPGSSVSGAKGGRGGFQQGPVPVTVGKATRQDLPLYVNGIGGVIAYNTVSLKSRVDGQIMTVNFVEGQHVKAGDLLIQIDPRTYQAAVAQAEGQLAKDQAALADAKVENARYQALYKEGVVSKESADAQQSTFGQSEGAIKADQAAIQTAKLNVQYAHITSPITGRVGLRQVDPGNLIQAASGTALVVITQLQPIAVDFVLPEDYLPAVRNAMKGGQKLHAEAWSRDNSTKLADGQLLTLDNQIDITTGTDKLKAVFPNENEQLWPNQFVNIRLLLEVQKNILAVPTPAVQRGPQGAYVYLVNADNTVKQQMITTGRSEGNLTEVLSGLEDGATVVVDGQSKLIPGSKIQPRPMSKQNNALPPGLSSAAPVGGQPLLGVTPSQSTTRGSTAPVNPTPSQIPGGQQQQPGKGKQSHGQGQGNAGNGQNSGSQ